MSKKSKANKRNSFILGLAKTALWPTIKTTSFKKYDIHPQAQKLMSKQKKEKNCSLVFAGPHRSMWETLLVPYTIAWHDGNLPFVAMGNNLVNKESGKKKKVFDYITSRMGALAIERENNPKSAIPVMIKAIEEIISENENFMIFPEGTRSRDGLIKEFTPSAFQGIIDAAKNTDVYIIPVNTDYSILYEINSFAEANSKTYRFKAKDYRKWRSTFLEDIYISFGKPVKVNETDERKELAYNTREDCLDLVKILPINVVSEAILQLDLRENEYIHPKSLEASVDNVVADLEEFQSKFRGFNVNTQSKKIIEKAKQKINPELMPVYEIYGNYIAEYLNLVNIR